MRFGEYTMREVLNFVSQIDNTVKNSIDIFFHVKV